MVSARCCCRGGKPHKNCVDCLGGKRAGANDAVGVTDIKHMAEMPGSPEGHKVDHRFSWDFLAGSEV